MTWSTWIDVEPDDTANEAVRRLYDDVRDKVTGCVSDDTVRLTSLTPQVASLLHSLRRAVHRSASGLTRREQEIAALVVSSYNG